MILRRPKAECSLARDPVVLVVFGFSPVFPANETAPRRARLNLFDGFETATAGMIRAS